MKTQRSELKAPKTELNRQILTADSFKEIIQKSKKGSEIILDGYIIENTEICFGVILKNCTLKKCTLKDCTFERCQLENCKLLKCYAYGCFFYEGCKVNECNFNLCELNDSIVKDCRGHLCTVVFFCIKNIIKQINFK